LNRKTLNRGHESKPSGSVCRKRRRASNLIRINPEGETDARRTAPAAAADARDAAFLGWHEIGRVAPAALQFLPEDVFPAAAVLPVLRLARRRRVQGDRQGPALQLCDPPPAGAGLYAALRDRRR